MTGLWGLKTTEDTLLEVRLMVHSTDDPRYSVERQVDRILLPGEVLVFEAALAPCRNYAAYLLGITDTGTEVKSLGKVFHTSCLDLAVKVEPQSGSGCEQPPAQRLNIRLAPMSLSGPLKLLAVSQTDAAGHEDVVFNVNRPQSVFFKGVKPEAYHKFVYRPDTGTETVTYPYVFAYDTSAHQEGPIDLKVRLVGINDEAIVVPITLLVDHTPPALALTYPPSNALVCGVPTVGQDGQMRRVVTIEGNVADAHGVNYTVKRIDNPELVYNSLAENGFLRRQSFVGWLGELSNLDEEVTIELEAFDWAGFHACTQRTFVVDGKADLYKPTLSHSVFSPGRTSLVVSYNAQEYGTLDMAVYAAQENQFGEKHLVGEALRILETRKILLNGSGSSIWDGRDATGTVVADGWYGVVLTFTDGCGNDSQKKLFVVVDTVPPQVVLHFPTSHDPLPAIVEVLGTVHDLHLQSYHVHVGVGAAPSTWELLATGIRPVDQEVVAEWNTFGSSGPHVLRLLAQDRAGNSALVEVPVDVLVRTHLLNGLAVTPSVMSPNGDGKRDHASISLNTTEHVRLTVTISRA